MSVYQKLQTARLMLQAMPLKKSGENKFAGYKYFELGDFLPTIQNIFADVGLCGIVSYETELASLRIVDVEDKSELTITSPMGGAAMKGLHAVQNIGAVETYQRRYLWITALEIVEHDALEATTGKHEPETTGTVQPITKPASAKPITKDTFDKLEFADQEMLREIAMESIVYLSRGQVGEAVDYMAQCELDADLKTALWSLFDSKQRAAMTKYNEQKKAA